MDEPVVTAIPSVGALGLAPTFEEFFETERTKLFRALLLMTHDAGDAEEIAQEAFCRLWERWEDVRSLDDPTGYLFRTAMNVHRSRYRRALRAAKRAIHQRDDVDPFEQVAAHDEAVRLLVQLTPRQRVAVVLTQLVGYSSDEASAVMGVRSGTVRALVSQARAALNPKEDLSR